jgi:hypothetical protein
MEGQSFGKTAWGTLTSKQFFLATNSNFKPPRVNSIHKTGQGHPLGTRWIYLRNGADGIQITKNGQATFYIGRCR